MVVNWLAYAGNRLKTYSIYLRVRVGIDACQWLAYAGIFLREEATMLLS